MVCLLPWPRSSWHLALLALWRPFVRGMHWLPAIWARTLRSQYFVRTVDSHALLRGLLRQQLTLIPVSGVWHMQRLSDTTLPRPRCRPRWARIARYYPFLHELKLSFNLQLAATGSIAAAKMFRLAGLTAPFSQSARAAFHG